ncbi:Com family DNA-binding transcriptional regulator [Pseudomonas pergaminensis]|uniref:Com family DNA-binding transcriptional regulator n=1 Tax=Pseudomonas pergaminensis TaxID=2853159 RepID=A0ABW8QWT9_9PSED
MHDIRCGHCARKLASVNRFDTLQIKCPRCGTINHLKAPSFPPASREHP